VGGTVTLEAPAAKIGARVAATRPGVGQAAAGGLTAAIDRVASLEEAGPRALAFYANPRYRNQLLATRAAAVIVGEDDVDLVPRSAVALVAAQPYVAFAKASTIFNPAAAVEPGIHPGAHVHKEAQVDATASVGAGAVVGKGARIGPRTALHEGVLVLEGAKVGAACILHAGSIVRERCTLGDRVVLQPGAVVGSDGFGFAFDLEGDDEHPGPLHRKIPQAGVVRIEDDVEVGACTCIDRATLGETVVGRGTKIDNLVQVGHNVRIGPLSLIVAQAGISGSTTLGQGVILAGQAGVVGHLHVGDGARVGAQSGVSRDVPGGETWSGSPAIPHRDWLRMVSALPRVPDLLRELRRLEKRVAELEARAPSHTDDPL
jgi:UDP-3-O-[3-hydroxymyristoyl] glucosamine N-acyltransferase